ncbi:18037_t:CDS:1, partial [Dentiscutata erythropus]
DSESIDNSAKKVEDVSRNKSKISNEDPKLDILGNKINLSKYFWDNVGHDDSVKKVESVKKKIVNIVNTFRDKEDKMNMSEPKMENLPESPDEKKIENNK